jgi:hypothetical protein
MMQEAKRKPLQLVPMVLITQLVILLLQLQFKSTEAMSISLSLLGSLDRYGEVLIPYLFGIGTMLKIKLIRIIIN